MSSSRTTTAATLHAQVSVAPLKRRPAKHLDDDIRDSPRSGERGPVEARKQFWYVTPKACSPRSGGRGPVEASLKPTFSARPRRPLRARVSAAPLKHRDVTP